MAGGKPETERALDGQVSWSAGAHLSVSVLDPPPGDGILTVLLRLAVTAAERGGLLHLTTPPAGEVAVSVLVLGAGRWRRRTTRRAIRVRAGDTLTVAVLAHPPGLSEDEIVGRLDALLHPAAAMEPAPAERGYSPPALQRPRRAGPPLEAAAPGPPPSTPATAVGIAEVGAGMPARVRLHARTTLRVTLSWGEVAIRAGETTDRQLIVVDPTRPVHVTVLRRGFTLAPGEVATRSLRLPGRDEPEVEVRFTLVAATPGPQEVQVVVRQQAPRPLATLRLTPHVVPEDAEVDEAGDLVRAATAVPPGVGRFLVPRTLTIDENFVGTTSELTFDLVTPSRHTTFRHTIPDKGAVLADLFARIEGAWEEHRGVPGRLARSTAFQDGLRDVGTRLAGGVMPAGLLQVLRDHPEEADALTVITSGETDIPWELVHVWDDPDDDLGGFLGRAGLVRWVYNTPNPVELTVRPDRGYVMVARGPDRNFLLASTAEELAYLTARGVREVDPLDAAAIARLITSGEVDLLHFCGHGRADDHGPVPVREMLLGPRDQAFSLADLAESLPEGAPGPFAPPGPLVVLNACRIGRPPLTRSETGGFAEAFLRGGAGAFVGCLWSVGDQPATGFVTALYDQLAAGATITDATLTARRAARAAGDTSWLAYTVYAHPDARLLPPGLHPRGSTMSTESSSGQVIPDPAGQARAGTTLTPGQLQALHPHTVALEDGRLSPAPQTAPTSVADFRTTAADVDALFGTHLPAFVAAHPGRPVPVVLYAHGGLVPKGNGLAIAHKQVTWWRDNGVFPIHFVWDTGFVDALVDALLSALPGRRGLFDFTGLSDGLIEQVARGLRARRVWSEMKKKAGHANQPVTGGAHYVVKQLARYAREHEGTIGVHAVGHSAGSIFHSHLVPHLIDQGVPVDSLHLLAPAIRVDEFRERLLAPEVFARIGSCVMYTMNRRRELDDNCGGLYRKSLLHLIRNALEAETGAAILGLQESVQQDAQLTRLFAGAGAEAIWSVRDGGPRRSSASTTHGGFDDDAPTMNSIARRILGTEQITTFPVARTGPMDGLWDRAVAPRPAAVPAGSGGRRALCIGIDAYPDGYALAGCVNDSDLWARTLSGLGFDVRTLHDEAATRDGIESAIRGLITASGPGDHLVVQYAGHGTTAPDLDRDEAREDADSVDGLRDEAICPVDFLDGQLILDDDLGALWDELPPGAGLTVFFDSCHSGGAQRVVIPVPDARPDQRPRLVRLPRSAEDKFVAARKATVTPAPRSRDRERGAFFGACLPDEVAWESDGHGDFTTRIIPLLAQAGTTLTNRDLFDQVLLAFGAGRRQTPVLRPPDWETAPVFGGPPADMSPPPVPGGTVPGQQAGPAEQTVSGLAPVQRDGVSARDRAMASVLRGLADLIES